MKALVFTALAALSLGVGLVAQGGQLAFELTDQVGFGPGSLRKRLSHPTGPMWLTLRALESVTRDRTMARLVVNGSAMDGLQLHHKGVPMTTAVKAVYQNGVFKPKEPLDLKDQTEVEVLIPSRSAPDDDPTGWKAAERLIGFIQDAPADMAEHHDHYLYGRPRE
jgi:predicted DNA-binding antitoxin AbrB/MazE fold protein